jgi:hypothetical protein
MDPLVGAFGVCLPAFLLGSCCDQPGMVRILCFHDPRHRYVKLAHQFSHPLPFWNREASIASAACSCMDGSRCEYTSMVKLVLLCPSPSETTLGWTFHAGARLRRSVGDHAAAPRPHWTGPDLRAR